MSVKEHGNSLWLKTPGAVDQIVYITNYLESLLPGEGPEGERILEETRHQHLKYFFDQSRIKAGTHKFVGCWLDLSSGKSFCTFN